MIRLLACVLGTTTVLVLAGSARADEPTENQPKKAKKIRVVTEEIREKKADSDPAEEALRLWRRVVKSNNGKPLAQDVVITTGKVKDGKHWTFTFKIVDGKPLLVSQRITPVIATQEELLEEVIEDVDELDETVEETVEIVMEEPIIKDVEIEHIEEGNVIKDGVIRLKTPKVEKKIKVLKGRVRNLLEEAEAMPWLELAESFVDDEVLKDIEIIIKTPDGKTHKLGGKDGKARNFIKRFRYEPRIHNKSLGKGLRIGHGDSVALRERVKRLEQHNKRMQHELELMRRRLNQIAGDKHAPRRPDKRSDRRSDKRPEDGGGMGDRLIRIEEMMWKLLKQAAQEQHEKRAKRNNHKHAKDQLRHAKELKRVQEAHRKVGHVRAKREKTTEQIEKRIQQSRKRIEELMREIAEKQAEAERIKARKK